MNLVISRKRHGAWPFAPWEVMSKRFMTGLSVTCICRRKTGSWLLLARPLIREPLPQSVLCAGQGRIAVATQTIQFTGHCVNYETPVFSWWWTTKETLFPLVAWYLYNASWVLAFWCLLRWKHQPLSQTRLKILVTLRQPTTGFCLD